MTRKPSRSVAGNGQSEKRCEFCSALLPVLTVFQEITFPGPCDCPQAIAQREVEAQLERNREAQQQAERERSLSNSIRRMFGELPEKFQDRTFENFIELPYTRSALEASRKYSEAFPTPAGLMFFGDIGTGKTHLAAAIANEQIKAGRSVLFGTVPTLLAKIRSTYGDERETEQAVMSVFFHCSLLVLDDLGKERVTEWVEERLYEIINGRYERNLPIIITTNVGLKAVKERYPLNGAAIVSRLHEMCPRGIMLKGPDYRLRKGQNQ